MTQLKLADVVPVEALHCKLSHTRASARDNRALLTRCISPHSVEERAAAMFGKLCRACCAKVSLLSSCVVYASTLGLRAKRASAEVPARFFGPAGILVCALFLL